MIVHYKPDCKKDEELMQKHPTFSDEFQTELYNLCLKFDKKYKAGFYISGQSWMEKEKKT